MCSIMRRLINKLFEIREEGGGAEEETRWVLLFRSGINRFIDRFEPYHVQYRHVERTEYAKSVRYCYNNCIVLSSKLRRLCSQNVSLVSIIILVII